MTPEELAARASELDDVVAMMEAIDDMKSRLRSGWDLAGWTYELVPWGVRFIRGTGTDSGQVVVLVGGPHRSSDPDARSRSAGLRVVVSAL